MSGPWVGWAGPRSGSLWAGFHRPGQLRPLVKIKYRNNKLENDTKIKYRKPNRE